MDNKNFGIILIALGFFLIILTGYLTIYFLL